MQYRFLEMVYDALRKCYFNSQKLTAQHDYRAIHEGLRLGHVFLGSEKDCSPEFRPPTMRFTGAGKFSEADQKFSIIQTFASVLCPTIVTWRSSGEGMPHVLKS
jgi:hypothetical protein